MDENHQNSTGNKQVASEVKLWLPPSYNNNKIPTPPAPKKRGINWGFADRTVFDWAILVSQVLGAIAIPFVVTMLGLYFTQQFTQQQAQLSERQHQIDLQIAKDNRQNDLQITDDQQRETTLRAYFDDMSTLLLQYKLRESQSNDEVRRVARTRTLNTLRRLDGNRKGLLIQFLYEAGLIDAPKTTSDHNNPIISLEKADLSTVQLTGVEIKFKGVTNLCHSHTGDTKYSDDPNAINLRAIDLRGADLKGADLSSSSIDCTDLSDADLSDADLSNARLTQDNLTHANLSGVTDDCLYIYDCNYVLSLSNLSQANLSYAVLPYVILQLGLLDKANLSYADLHNADLSLANLNGANLQGIQLLSASLQKANLSNADLSGAFLDEANLKDTIGITNQGLEKQAKSLSGTIMPDGSIHAKAVPPSLPGQPPPP